VFIIIIIVIIYIYIYIYTGCFILNNALKFFGNYGKYYGGKMFQTKIVWFRENI